MKECFNAKVELPAEKFYLRRMTFYHQPQKYLVFSEIAGAEALFESSKKHEKH